LPKPTARQKVVVGHETEPRPLGSTLAELTHDVPSHFTGLPGPAKAMHRLDEAHDTALIWPWPIDVGVDGTPFQVITSPL
jgi:hypothetical protein